MVLGWLGSSGYTGGGCASVDLAMGKISNLTGHKQFHQDRAVTRAIQGQEREMDEVQTKEKTKSAGTYTPNPWQPWKPQLDDLIRNRMYKDLRYNGWRRSSVLAVSCSLP